MNIVIHNIDAAVSDVQNNDYVTIVIISAPSIDGKSDCINRVDVIVKGSLYSGNRITFLRDYVGVESAAIGISSSIGSYLSYYIGNIWFSLKDIHMFKECIITQILLNLDRMA